MKTITKKLATKIRNNRYRIYDTKRYRYLNVGECYYRIPLELLGTTEALSWDNWERLEVRA